MKQQGQMFSQLNELIKCIRQVNLNLAIEQIPNKVLLLMGQTRAGKTTLLYYLLKKKLVLEHNNELNLTVMKAEVQYLNAQIGNNYQSTTVYPNIPPGSEQGDCLIIDMPGFSDSRPLFRLLNIYIIEQTIKKIKNVHVSIVIPFESLEGEALISALHNTCYLLNNDFLKAAHCSSFVLTKLEDKQSDEEVFKEQMEYLQNEQIDDPIRSIISHFSEINTYTFCNQEPNEEEGAQLKEKIIKQNQFYPVNENPENLLSSTYAEVIVGRGNLEQFNFYVVDLLREIKRRIPLLIEFLGELIKIQHFTLLSECLEWEKNLDDIKDKIKDISIHLPLGDINQRNFLLSEGTYAAKSDEIKAFLNKMAGFIEGKEQSIMSQTGQLDKFIVISQYFANEQNGISKELRKTLNLIFRNIVLIIRTIGEVRNEEVQNEMDTLKIDENIKLSMDRFIEGFQLNNMIAKLSETPELKQIARENEVLHRFIVSYNPNFSLGGEAIKYVYEKKHNKLKNAKWQHSVEDTTRTLVQIDVSDYVINKKLQLKPQNGSEEQINNLLVQLHQLENSSSSLKQILSTLKHYVKNKAKKIDEQFYLSELVRKSIKILDTLQLKEEAIMFALAIPDQNEAQILIEQGMTFGEISIDCINDVLIPYYSNATSNFLMIEKLVSYASLRANSLKQLMEIQKKYASIIKTMRQMLTQGKNEQQFQYSRLNFDFIDYFLQNSGFNQLMIRAQRNYIKLIRSKISYKGMMTHFKKLQDLNQP